MVRSLRGRRRAKQRGPEVVRLALIPVVVVADASVLVIVAVVPVTLRLYPDWCCSYRRLTVGWRSLPLVYPISVC